MPVLKLPLWAWDVLSRSEKTRTLVGHERSGGCKSLAWAHMLSRITADDFFAGLFAALAVRGEDTLSIRVDQFDPVVKSVFDFLSENAEQEQVQLRFRIQPHPIHRDSLTIQGALARAAQRDLISFDNPEYQDIRIKLDAEEARRVLRTLPGAPDLYDRLADRFVGGYANVATASS
jgi:hypothetical protein